MHDKRYWSSSHTRSPLIPIVCMVTLFLQTSVVLPVFGQQSLPNSDRPTATQGELFHANLPTDWTIDKFVELPKQNLGALSKRMGGAIVRLTNSFIKIDGSTVQINIVHCENAMAASAVHQFMLGVHKNPSTVYLQDAIVVEFVGKDLPLILRAKDRLIAPRSITYHVTFDAVPIATCSDYMQWNRFFNQLAASSDPSSIAQTTKAFQFTNNIAFRQFGLGDKPNQFKLSPNIELIVDKLDGFVGELAEPNPPTSIPRVSVDAMVQSTSFATRPVLNATKTHVESNRFWPSNDPKIQNLAIEITKGATHDKAKVDAILKWMKSGQSNLQYGGNVVGSRFGAIKFLEQRKGHCWDFSDLFISLCRSLNIPARQVFGWLHNQSGHVWAEVAIDGNWHQFDPTSGGPCSSEYIPLMQSDNGETPWIYASMPVIEIVSMEKRKLE